MAVNQTLSFRLEQRSVIKYLAAKKCKALEICRIMCSMYGDATFSQRNVYQWTKNGFVMMNQIRKDSP